MLNKLKDALVSLTEQTYHYFAPPNTRAPYIVWAEDGDSDLMAENGHAERCATGTVDLFTREENDPLAAYIPRVLEEDGISYYLNSVQYETETGLIHYEWVFEVV